MSVHKEVVRNVYLYIGVPFVSRSLLVLFLFALVEDLTHQQSIMPSLQRGLLLSSGVISYI